MLGENPNAPLAVIPSVADRLPPVQVILPASAEAAMAPQLPVETAVAIEPRPAVSPIQNAQQGSRKR